MIEVVYTGAEITDPAASTKQLNVPAQSKWLCPVRWRFKQAYPPALVIQRPMLIPGTNSIKPGASNQQPDTVA